MRPQREFRRRQVQHPSLRSHEGQRDERAEGRQSELDVRDVHGGDDGDDGLECQRQDHPSREQTEDDGCAAGAPRAIPRSPPRRCLA
jgi:hypothetical protein